MPQDAECKVCGARPGLKATAMFANKHSRAGVPSCELAKRYENTYRVRLKERKRRQSARETITVQDSLEQGQSLKNAARFGGIPVEQLKNAIAAFDSGDTSDPDRYRKGRAWAMALARYDLNVRRKANEAMTPRYGVTLLLDAQKNQLWDTSTPESSRAKFNAYEEALKDRLEKAADNGSK